MLLQQGLILFIYLFTYLKYSFLFSGRGSFSADQRNLSAELPKKKKKSEGFVLFFVNGKKSLFLHPFFADFVSFQFPVSQSHCREEKKTQHQCGQIMGATMTQVFFHFLPSPEKTYNNF